MTDKKTKSPTELIAVIRIRGMVKVPGVILDALDIMRLRRKYACILLEPTKENLGMLKKVRFYVAYGKIDKETLVELLKARGQMADKSKINAEKIAEELLNGKRLQELNVKPFYRLHPARGGMNTKQHYPVGVIGNHSDKIK
jgi:large subunit ribosomal protein L30